MSSPSSPFPPLNPIECCDRWISSSSFEEREGNKVSFSPVYLSFFRCPLAWTVILPELTFPLISGYWLMQFFHLLLSLQHLSPPCLCLVVIFFFFRVILCHKFSVCRCCCCINQQQSPNVEHCLAFCAGKCMVPKLAEFFLSSSLSLCVWCSMCTWGRSIFGSVCECLLAMVKVVPE